MAKKSAGTMPQFRRRPTTSAIGILFLKGLCRKQIQYTYGIIKIKFDRLCSGARTKTTKTMYNWKWGKYVEIKEGICTSRKKNS